MASPAPEQSVLRVGRPPAGDLVALLQTYGLRLSYIADDGAIPGSYWGEPEAGLIGNRLFVRGDTPLHSILHEAAHFICMSQDRREHLDTDAGGSHAEENGVCYLQVLLADGLAGVGRERMLADMDRWGYTFRLGAARRWFNMDASDASDWLRAQGLVTADLRPTGSLRP